MYPLNRKDVVLDVSGNANPNGTAHNVVTASGPYNTEHAVTFWGTSTSYIRIHNNGELQMDASFSISVWIYRSSTWFKSDGNIVTFVPGDQKLSGLMLTKTGWHSNRIVGTLYFPSTHETFKLGSLSQNYLQWQHVALIYNYRIGYASLLIDGSVHDTEFVGSHSVGTSGDIVVGESFRGRVACLQLYRRPLLAKHVHDARDKCYRGNPDPPVCPLSSDVMHSPCSGSSSATSLSSDQTSTSSTYPSVSKVSLYILETSYTAVVTQTRSTVPISNTDTIVSSMLMYITSNIGVQSTAAVVSDYESSTIISLTRTSNVSTLITITKSSSMEASKPTPLVSHQVTLSSASNHMSNSTVEQVVPTPPVTGSSKESTLDIPRSISTIINLTRDLNSVTTITVASMSFLEASQPSSQVTLMSHHVTISVSGSRVSNSTVETVIPYPPLTGSTASSSIKYSTVDTSKSLSTIMSSTRVSKFVTAIASTKRLFSEASSKPTPSLTTISIASSKRLFSEASKPTPLLTTISTASSKRLFSEASKPTPSLTPMSHHITWTDSHLTKSIMTTSVPSPPLTGTVTSSTIKGDKMPSANLTQWSDWSFCSKPCGTGNQSRTRRCNSTENADCVGELEDTKRCNNHSCEAVSLNITAILADWDWDDSLLIQNSTNFRSLENMLRHNIKELYSSDPRYPDLVDVKLLSCRRGSVIVHFSVVFEAVDSNQVIKLMDDMEREGIISALPVVLVNVTADKVPNQSPTIVKWYLTSATSLRLFWTAVQEPIAGYQVAYRTIASSNGVWNSVYVTPQTLSLLLGNLREGDLYRIRVAAFNISGNGIPSRGVEIRIKEGVPRMPPVVSVSDIKTASSLIVVWSAIPEEHVQGKLQGYHVMYKSIKVADRKVDIAAPLTVTASATGRLEVTLTSLSAFTLYSITVTGFTAQGDGPASVAVFGETCVCPQTLYTNWVPYPPYVTLNEQQPGGIIGELITDMIVSSCGTCQVGYGETILDTTHNGKGAPAMKTSMGGVRADVDDKTHVSFPIIGHMEDEKYLKDFVFIPVVKSPGIAFISLANKMEEIGVVLSAVKKCWPVLVLSVVIAYLAAVLIWFSERRVKKDAIFPRSFLRGTGELTWFTLITMTTVGFGEKVPVKVVSKLLTIVWILVGLVLLSVFIATLTVSFTVLITEETGMIYGAKVIALKDSPAHRLGILRNAKVDPKETLKEAFADLENKKTEGVLLDAYVAGSSLKDVYRVNKVIATSNGLGVVLSGDALVLRFRVQDFVKKNAKRITEIIQNSTSPLKQPDKSVAAEKAQNLVSYASSTYRSAITVTASVLVVSILVGVAWELVRKRRQRKTRGYSIRCGKFQSSKAEMEKIINNFYTSFSQVYQTLRMKHIKQIQLYQAGAREQESNETSETKL